MPAGEALDTMAARVRKPLEAGYGNTGFMFSFDAGYQYGGGIASIGTYTPGQRRDRRRLRQRAVVPFQPQPYRAACLVQVVPSW